MAVETGYEAALTIGGSGLINCKSISHGGLEAADVKLTHLASPSNVDQFQKGTIEPGTIAASTNYDPGAAYWYSRVQDPDVGLEAVLVEFRDGSQCAGSGFVSFAKLGVGSADDPVAFDIEVQMSGPLDVTDA